MACVSTPPNPPRTWSRVQNSCSTYTSTDSNPSVSQTLSLATEAAMLNKGNVLQYKANSSNLTQWQRYSKIARGQWVNRNTTWATQNTRGYTNPNTTSLKRTSSAYNIAINPSTGQEIGPTTLGVTCLLPVVPDTPVLPSNNPGNPTDNSKIPPVPPPVPNPGGGGGGGFPVTPDKPVAKPVVVQDGGSLICSVQENICTGETRSTLSQKLCHPTTDSNVPGRIQSLCWNDGTPTWYPKQRYVMSSSDSTLFLVTRGRQILPRV
jgi:hypothetical protein